MKVLFYGDVVARSGREAVKDSLKRHLAQGKIDFVIMNGENAAHGNGILPEMAQEFLDLGVDAITMGNHTWDQRQIVSFLSSCTRIVRPANYPDHPAYRVPGRGSIVVESQRTPGLKLGIIQVMGRVFMDALDCPFRVGEKEANKLESLGIQSILVDFHGEATSEKQAFSYYMDGKVSAVIGTHSHVQTADERVLPGGTAMISDAGMCGCMDSVIGVKKEISIQKFLTKRPIRYEPAEGPGTCCGVVIEIDESTGKALSIERFREEPCS